MRVLLGVMLRLDYRCVRLLVDAEEHSVATDAVS